MPRLYDGLTTIPMIPNPNDEKAIEVITGASMRRDDLFPIWVSESVWEFKQGLYRFYLWLMTDCDLGYATSEAVTFFLLKEILRSLPCRGCWVMYVPPEWDLVKLQLAAIADKVTLQNKTPIVSILSEQLRNGNVVKHLFRHMNGVWNIDTVLHLTLEG